MPKDKQRWSELVRFVTERAFGLNPLTTKENMDRQSEKEIVGFYSKSSF